ncbi:hypothetical protein DAMA08_051240 [Martiniozyma asiatica (nom. inval.)]|nr:hypothetical protein DAMA08_051240 [Martiniozyma asiatica]
MYNNESYSGYFNDIYLDASVPKVSAVNIASKGVLPSVSSFWNSRYNSQVSEGYFTSTTTLTTNISTVETTGLFSFSFSSSKALANVNIPVVGILGMGLITGLLM